MNTVTYLLTFIPLISAVIVGLVILVNNYKSAVHRWTGSLILFCALWGVAATLPNPLFSDQTNLLIIRFAFIFAIGMSYSLMRFALVLSRRQGGKLVIWNIASIVALVLTMTPLSLASSSAQGNIITVEREPMYFAVLAVIILQALAGIVYLLTYYRRLKPSRSKAQIALVLAGLAAGSLAAITTNAILPNLFSGLQSSYFAWVTVTIFTIVLVYAVLRHNFLDIKATLSESAGYILATLLLIVLYYGLNVLFDVLGILSGRNDSEYMMRNVLMLALLSGLHWRFRGFFAEKTGQILARRKYKVSELYRQLAAKLTNTSSLEDILRIGSEGLRRYVGFESVGIYARNSSGAVVRYSSGRVSKLDDRDYEKLVQALGREKNTRIEADPYETTMSELQSLVIANGFVSVRAITSPDGVLGIICSGVLKRGAYSSDDAEAIDTVASELSTAIEKALSVETIKHFNTQLQEKVDEATVELKATNKRLKQMDQTKDEFISLTSHQLRTPLTTIKGYISMLLDGDAGELQPQQRKLLEEAFNSSQRMVHLISDFLNISRIQTGKFMIELADVNLADILDEEIEQLRISALSRQINLHYDKPADFPIMPLDDGKIRQVMMNFIDNAIYYSPANSTITVTLSHTTSTVEFKVIDQGIGVPKDEQHKLFAKFSRASNAKRQRPDGTGIGLFMAKKVIVALGGAIIFQSEEGKGSTFGFRLNRPKS